MSRVIVSIPGGTYAVKPATVAHARHSWAAQRLAEWCETDLYTGPLRIEWYLDPEAASPGAQRRALRAFVNEDEPCVIHVRADQSELETLRSVGHEAYHLYEYREGRTPDEQRAEAYGRRVADQYLQGDIR